MGASDYSAEFPAMLAVITSGALLGVESSPVLVEVNVSDSVSPIPGEFRIFTVGLPDSSVRESADRVLAAMRNSGFRLPDTRTTVNLAPGDQRKEGPIYDLPIALALLAATHQLPPLRFGDYVVAGELGLSGAVRPVRGGVAFALQARATGKRGVILPRASAEEAALVEGVSVHPVDSLHEAVRFLRGEREIAPLDPAASPFRRREPDSTEADFSEVKGQYALRRAVEVAVAGGHNLVMIGPPGSGKSMVAKRIPGIMPDPSLDEFLEILGIQSAAGISLSVENRRFRRPFRAPHHTISDAGLIGGGAIPGPGEISLAHRGVLFLDELPEFKRGALEVMRQPLEDGSVCISRAAGKVSLPAAFMLVAAMNPCPCGHLGDRRNPCRCSPDQVRKYRARISGPLLDRIDLHVEAPALGIEELQAAKPGEASAPIRARVVSARRIQEARLGPGLCNARMSSKALREHCVLDGELSGTLRCAMERLGLSARAYDRILKVSRTLADLEGTARIGRAHLMEAIQYRSLDRARPD